MATKKECMDRFDNNEKAIKTLADTASSMDTLVHNHYTEFRTALEKIDGKQEVLRVRQDHNNKWAGACVAVCGSTFAAVIALIALFVVMR